MKRRFDNFTAVDSGLVQDKVINDEYFNLGGFLGDVVDTVTGAVQSGVDTLGNVVDAGSQIIQGQTTGMNQSGCVKPLGYALDFKKIRQSSRNYDACLAAANAVDPDTQAFKNLVEQLPEKYQTALQNDNLTYDLNSSQQETLITTLTNIAKNVNLSGAAKISSAITTIENALPYLKESATTSGTTSPNETRSESSDQELQDARKKAWIGLGIVGGVAVLGYVTYLIIKKRK